MRFTDRPERAASSSEAFIEFCDVSKIFFRQSERVLLGRYVKALFQHQPRDRFYALKKVCFRINHGENVAIVGPNGSGKSTLLSLAIGLTPPDEGTVTASGRIAGLLELGSGFHQDLTGRENVFLNASLLGFTRRGTEEMLESVIEFADIGDFIDERLRTYSSGMTMRLAFSVAVNLSPDFLIVDEVLSVGDTAFQQKCFRKIDEMKRNG